MLNEEEISLLLTDLIDIYGYDFTGYAKPTLYRRINRLFKLRSFSGFTAFRYLLIHNPEYLDWFIAEITVPVTEMFRDPSFFLTLRNEVLPVLNNCPLIRIWHAGCSTGEEAYSLAIILKELQLLQKSVVYATDINPKVLKVAAAGIYQQDTMKHYTENYMHAGGIANFSDYYTAHYDLVKLDDQLKKRIVFSTHNLAADTSFNNFQLIICRNVLIYFNQELQQRVFTLFDNSLETNGFLGLGSKETLQFTRLNHYYQKLNQKEKIWQKR
ncbi:CheR family methyltransferase [Mucilaginibacter arboris]|uniref:Protein-glutamate O-methyltransferase CheR n=1 Tax=Mucilaginibacter arboris TaxID=2682090 RepID=A0A7K1SYK0_9SPHI|nr:protein-glutamate O-methyltransferase CheR [Mucilaginibacter arboris]MVN22392.1 protein-glutamate O-methyltransferase CheR [Mucilaginibacter arboris]